MLDMKSAIIGVLFGVVLEFFLWAQAIKKKGGGLPQQECFSSMLSPIMTRKRSFCTLAVDDIKSQIWIFLQILNLETGLWARRRNSSTAINEKRTYCVSVYPVTEYSRARYSVTFN